MAISDRALQAFENELVKCLSFSFTTVRRVDKDGNARTFLRIWLRNNARIALTGIRGSIAPGPAARFRYGTFHAARLAPGAELEVAEIVATIVEPLSDPHTLDRVARVNVSGGVDMKEWRFKDTDRSLVYVAPDGRRRPPVEPIRHGSAHGVEDGSIRLPETGLPLDWGTEGGETLELDWGRVRGSKRRLA